MRAVFAAPKLGMIELEVVQAICNFYAPNEAKQDFTNICFNEFNEVL